MRHDFLDRYSRIDSPIHRLPAAAKLAGALVILVCVVIWPASRLSWLLLAAGFLLGAAVLSRIPPGFLAKRLLTLEPFVAGVALLSLLQPGGWRIFVVLLARGTLCLFTVILLTNSTPFAEILRVLRRAHFPGLLITTLALMYRYLFVLIDEAERMSRARAARTFNLSGKQKWKLVASVAGQLFVRSSERAERIYAAMCARGWKT